eukprot:19678-Rhodomonas_salina.3
MAFLRAVLTLAVASAAVNAFSVPSAGYALPSPSILLLFRPTLRSRCHDQGLAKLTFCKQASAGDWPDSQACVRWPARADEAGAWRESDRLHAASGQGCYACAPDGLVPQPVCSSAPGSSCPQKPLRNACLETGGNRNWCSSGRPWDGDLRKCGEQEAAAKGGELGLIEGKGVALIHPIVSFAA